MSSLTRRRFIAVAAAVGLAPGASVARPVATWRGIALGAGVEIHLSGMTQAEAAPIFAEIVGEISRLERIFSLYRPNSAISRLNQRGMLATPPAELLQVLSLTNSIHQATEGAFDPTIQVLWKLFATVARKGRTPRPDEVSAVHELVDWSAVHFDSALVSFGRRGMAVTLNGIAQGFITDRIAGKLRALGLRDVLVDMGELRASGTGPDGASWSALIANPDGGRPIHRVTLRDRALATSASHGTVLDKDGVVGHIFDPWTGRPASNVGQVSVSAPTATVADGLSTAFCVMRRPQIATALLSFEGTQLEDLTV